MEAAPPNSTPAVSTSSLVSPAVDATSQVPSGATDPCLLSSIILPDGSVQTRRDVIYEVTSLTQTSITAQLFSSPPPGSDASDPRRPYVRTLPLGWKYEFSVGRTDASGNNVTIEHHSSQLGSVPVTIWTNGVSETLLLPGRQTTIRYCRHPKAETNLGTHLQAPKLQDVSQHKDTLNGIKREGGDTSATTSNAGVKKEVKREPEW